MPQESEHAYLIVAYGDSDVERFVAEREGNAAEEFLQAFRERFGYLPFSTEDEPLSEAIIDQCLQTGNDILVRVVSGRVERYR